MSILTLTCKDYVDVVLATGPVFYVPMQGTSVVEVVKGAKASVSATAPVIATGPFPGANSYKFSASTADNDYIEVAADASYALTNPGPWSVGGWFYKNGVGSGFSVLMDGWGLVCGFLAGTDTFLIRQPSVGNMWTSTTTIAKGRWYHVMFVRVSGLNVSCYLNGYPFAGNYSNRAQGTSGGPIRFGLTSGSTTDDLDGSLAHWGLWKKVLSAGEILELYLAGINQG